MKCHRRAFSFSPSDSLFHSLAVEGGVRWGTLYSISVNNGAQSTGRRNLTMYPGAIFDYSEWLWLRVCPGRWQAPTLLLPSLLPPPLEMSRLPVLCVFPWPASLTAAVHWYVHSSRPTGLTALWQWFLPYMAIRALGLSAGQDNFLPLLWLAAQRLRERWDLGVCGEGKPLSQVQRTFNSFLVFWSLSLCRAQDKCCRQKSSVHKHDGPSLGKQRRKGSWMQITLK